MTVTASAPPPSRPAPRPHTTGISRRARTRRLGIIAVMSCGVALVRRWQLRWGATDAEVTTEMPGDDLLSHVSRCATRAVTIDASPCQVWPWLAQMGQGRGGFYSYDVLENLIGCDIRSASRIVDAWQHIAIGDPFRLHPDVALRVVGVQPDHALVLQGAVPIGDSAPPYDFTWAFVVNELPDGTTRLVIRERYAFTHAWASLIVEPALAVSFVMTRRMLRGIRTRSEHQHGAGNVPPPPTPRSDPSISGLPPAGVYLYWLPLGAGAHVVRVSGRVFETIMARLQQRRPLDLYHSALEVVTDDERFVIEMTPIPAHDGQDRGVVANGAVGSGWARRFRVSCYEIRRWRNGVISDVARAVDSPVRVSTDSAVAERLLELAAFIPTPVWGRDQLGAGEMWNSNSVTSWLLSSGGIDVAGIRPPADGRAPGWDAGRVVARRAMSSGPVLLRIDQQVSA
jgi:hypothetical protein